MGILDKLFGAGRGRKDQARVQQGPEIVPLADRTPIATFEARLQGVSDVNHDGSSRQAAIRRSAVGEETVLMQEPRPRGHPPVIAVWSATSGEQLGTLPSDTSGYVLLQARRHDFRSSIQELPEQEDGGVEVVLQIEMFEKQA